MTSRAFSSPHPLPFLNGRLLPATPIEEAYAELLLAVLMDQEPAPTPRHRQRPATSLELPG